MEIQLQELIDKIKKDGIDSASSEAVVLKKEAEAEAARIIAAAHKEAADIITRGKADAERSEKAGIAALEQASRNLILAFKSEIQGLLDKIVAQSSAAAYGEDALKATLPEVLAAWSAKGGDKPLDILLTDGDLKKLSSWFNDKLAGELKKGVELKPVRNLSSGFRIAEKDGSAYYDFSAEAVAQLLSAYVNPRLAEILGSSSKGM
ncbi:MAG: V-type ATP synthase subunit E [Treponema sp.]|nr:V-type ATP synthase subunit E [Treponema sp.]